MQLNHLSDHDWSLDEPVRPMIVDYFFSPAQGKVDDTARLITRLQYLKDDYENHARGLYGITDREFWNVHRTAGYLVEKVLVKGAELVTDAVARLEAVGIQVAFDQDTAKLFITVGKASFQRKVDPARMVRNPNPTAKRYSVVTL